MPQSVESFRRRLTLAMAARGISQAELARRLGRAQSSVNGWWTANAVPDGEAMLALPTALGVRAAWLLAGQGAMEGGDDAPPSVLYYRGAEASIAEAITALEAIKARWHDEADATARAAEQAALELRTGLGRRASPPDRPTPDRPKGSRRRRS